MTIECQIRQIWQFSVKLQKFDTYLSSLFFDTNENLKYLKRTITAPRGRNVLYFQCRKRKTNRRTEGRDSFLSYTGCIIVSTNTEKLTMKIRVILMPEAHFFVFILCFWELKMRKFYRFFLKPVFWFLFIALKSTIFHWGNSKSYKPLPRLLKPLSLAFNEVISKSI